MDEDPPLEDVPTAADEDPADEDAEAPEDENDDEDAADDADDDADDTDEDWDDDVAADVLALPAPEDETEDEALVPAPDDEPPAADDEAVMDDDELAVAPDDPDALTATHTPWLQTMPPPQSPGVTHRGPHTCCAGWQALPAPQSTFCLQRKDRLGSGAGHAMTATSPAKGSHA